MSRPTTSFARLVCGLDDSDRAAAVLAVASDLADRLGLTLQLVHSPHHDVFAVGEERARLLARGHRLLDRLDRAACAGERVVELGHAEDLLRACLDDHAALAVVGSRGRGAARAAVLGSVSRALAASAPCPVVVVPPAARERIARPPVVLCGLDGFEEGGVPLWHAAGLAAALGGELVVVHVRGATISGHPGWGPLAWGPDTGDEAIRAIERELSELGHDIPMRLRIESGDAVHALRVVADEEAADLIVVGSRGQGPVGSALLGSVSMRLAADAPAPVVVVPPTALVPPPAAERPVAARAQG